VNRTVTIDDNSQVLLPDEIREALDLQPGDELLVELDGMKVVLRPKPTAWARRLAACTKRCGKTWMPPSTFVRRGNLGNSVKRGSNGQRMGSRE